MTKRKNIVKIILILLVIFIAWLAWGNLTVGVTHYKISDSNIPKEFKGYKIVQLSDIHNAVYGKENKGITKKLIAEKPHIIVITGDAIDSRHTDKEAFMKLAQEIVKIAPCYYITGNHEARFSAEYLSTFTSELEAMGVIVLRNEMTVLERNGAKTLLVGIDDPLFVTSWNDKSKGTRVAKEIEEVKLKKQLINEKYNISIDETIYKILLSHRPEFMEVYKKEGINLVFSGHAHGGQVRIPFIGGIIAPNQGFFPKYDGGLYKEGKTTMIVSRGIGNSVIPVRVNNRPEIVSLTFI